MEHGTINFEIAEQIDLRDFYRPVVMGADNGYSGYLVFLDVETAKIVHIEQYPRDNAHRLYFLLSMYNPQYAVVEQPFMAGGFRGVASSNFEILGRYKQCFELLDIKYDTVRATSWRKVLKIKATATHNEKGEQISSRDSNKFAAIDFAKEIFAEQFNLLECEEGHIVNHKRVKSIVPDDNKVESACIAYYTLQTYKETLKQ